MVEHLPNYFPPLGEWARLDPETAGFNKSALDAAIRYAIDTEIDWPEEVGLMVGLVDRDLSSPSGKKEKELVLAPGTSGSICS